MSDKLVLEKSLTTVALCPTKGFNKEGYVKDV